jgi:hypothetical protein
MGRLRSFHPLRRGSLEGCLEGFQVDVPEQGIHYFKYIVAGFDVDPDTIRPLG